MADPGSEAQFRRVIEATPDGMVVSRNGVVLFSNPAAVRFLGYDSPADLVGKPISMFLDPAELALMRDRVAATAAGGAPLGPQEYGARRRDGVRVTAEITSLPIEWDGGPAVIALVRDVTERARMQQELALADRLRAVGTLAAGVAHEVNNPLAYMGLAVESLQLLLESQLTGEARAAASKMLAEVRDGAQRVSTIVSDLRTFAQDGAEGEARASTDVAEVLATVKRLVAHDVRHRATLVIEPAALPPVALSARRLEQIVVNLVLYAAQVVEGHGRSPQVRVRALAEGEGNVVIEVTDNGPGIAPDLLPRIFEPFFAAKLSQVSRGLGLAICHRLATEARGTLTARSALGQGTSFRVTLPIAPPAVTAAPAPAPAPAPARERLRVLVVDDEPAIGRLLSAVLGHHDVTVLGSGASALERLRADHAYDIVVCDLMLPTVTGIDVYTAAAEEHPGLERRFIFITGGAFTERARSFIAKVPNRRLDKPFTIRALEQAMAETIAEARTD